MRNWDRQQSIKFGGGPNSGILFLFPFVMCEVALFTIFIRHIIL